MYLIKYQKGFHLLPPKDQIASRGIGYSLKLRTLPTLKTRERRTVWETLVYTIQIKSDSRLITQNEYTFIHYKYNLS